MGDATFGAIITAASAAAQAGVSAKQNSKNRAFQKEQRETAFQTQRTDLELAGYNPLYAFNSANRGASTNVPVSHDISAGIGRGVSSGLEAFKAQAQNRALSAQTGRDKSQDKKFDAEAKLADTIRVGAGIQNQSSAMGLQADRNSEDIEKSNYGKWLRLIDRTGRAVNPFMRGGKAIRGSGFPSTDRQGRRR